MFDSVAQTYVGMLTITDFINILHKYYKSGPDGGVKELQTHKIATWTGAKLINQLVNQSIFPEELRLSNKVKRLIWIDPNESLFKAVQVLCENKIHRLPVLDRQTGNIAYILTHKRIIKYLYLYVRSALPCAACITNNVDYGHATAGVHAEDAERVGYRIVGQD